MILLCELQLGTKEQTIIGYDAATNKQKVQARIEMSNLADALCGFYYNYSGEKVILQGPEALCQKIATEANTICAQAYANREPINIVIC